jgi:Aspartyl/Asparaginyl beta-hydroxylase
MTVDEPIERAVASTAPAGHRLPQAVQLGITFDPERLVADLHNLSRGSWTRQRSLADGSTVTEAEVDWRCRPLRSVGGDPERTDSGGPGLDGFADTSWLRRAPYLAEVLSSIPAQLRGARLLALGPGAASRVHSDTKHGLTWGTARLHVPITTTPGAVLLLEGEPHRWEPGALWFADSSRSHQVANTDDVTRVHLVVDALVSDALMEFFPEEYRALLTPEHLLVNAEPVSLSPAEAAMFRVQCRMPVSFLDREEDGTFQYDPNWFTATVEAHGTRVLLLRDGRPVLGLVHIGGGEFRFAGWTDERTIKISLGPFAPSVGLRTRRGARVRELRVSAESLAPLAAA